MLADFEKRWEAGCFGAVMISSDVVLDNGGGAKEFVMKLVHQKIREAVNDPDLHEILSPK